MHGAPDSEVAAAFSAYPAEIRERLYRLRELIFEVAAETPGVGQLTETLKWGEPAYLTEQSKSGSTIRLGWKPSYPDHYAMYLNCQTTLVDTYRTLFPELRFEGNRAIVFSIKDDVPGAAARQCIELALTYHAGKRKNRKRAG